jgi:hypothetical protein
MSDTELETVENTVRNTTTGPPGFSTATTGRRITAPSTISQGVGVVNAARAVEDDETTIIDPGVYVGGALSLMTFAGFAYPLADKSPEQVLQTIRPDG